MAEVDSVEQAMLETLSERLKNQRFARTAACYCGSVHVQLHFRNGRVLKIDTFRPGPSREVGT